LALVVEAGMEGGMGQEVPTGMSVERAEAARAGDRAGREAAVRLDRQAEPDLALAQRGESFGGVSAGLEGVFLPVERDPAIEAGLGPVRQMEGEADLRQVILAVDVEHFAKRGAGRRAGRRGREGQAEEQQNTHQRARTGSSSTMAWRASRQARASRLERSGDHP
jgi:hypothetical protein